MRQRCRPSPDKAWFARSRDAIDGPRARRDARSMRSHLTRVVPLLLAASAAFAGEPRAVATFESIGIYWSPPSPPPESGCAVRFRRAGETQWREGLPLWFDARNGECRGSLVQLDPGTRYEIDLGGARLAASTWPERFPVARTVRVPPGKSLRISEGGSAAGYVVYEGDGAVLDANDE